MIPALCCHSVWKQQVSPLAAWYISLMQSVQCPGHPDQISYNHLVQSYPWLFWPSHALYKPRSPVSQYRTMPWIVPVTSIISPDPPVYPLGRNNCIYVIAILGRVQNFVISILGTYLWSYKTPTHAHARQAIYLFGTDGGYNPFLLHTGYVYHALLTQIK